MIVQLVVTDRIRDAIAQVLVIKSIPEDLRNELQKWKRSRNGATKVEDVAVDDNSTISFRTVQKMVQLLKKAGKVIYLNELLEGSGLYFEPIQEPKKSPELVARLEKLQAEQDQIQYRMMVKNIDRELTHNSQKKIAFEVRSTRQQLSTIVNFALSVGGTFVFGFMSSQFAFTNIGLRVIFGLILASIVGLAELYFMARTEI